MKAYPWQSSRIPQFTERLFNIAVIGRSAILQCHNQPIILILIAKKAFLGFLDVFPLTQDIGKGGVPDCHGFLCKPLVLMGRFYYNDRDMISADYAH